MRRIDTPNREVDLFGPGKDGFRNGNLALGVAPTEFNAEWVNAVQEELMSVIEAADLVPDGGDLSQARKAIGILLRKRSSVVSSAGGTADAITAAFTPAVTALSDGQMVMVRAAAANATATPTFKADGTAAKTIVRGNGLPLLPGDIRGAGHWIELLYDQTLDVWVLRNPRDHFEGMVGGFARNTAPPGWLKANGAAVSRTTYAALFAAIGTTFGAGDGATTFNVPDLRGEFVRGWDDGRGIDSGRAFGSTQKGSLTSYDTAVATTPEATVSVSVLNSPTFANSQIAAGVDAYNTADYPGVVMANATAVSSTALPGPGAGVVGSGVVRPRNLALLYCIKY
jgi:phage-related tail fiber protein